MYKYHECYNLVKVGLILTTLNYVLYIQKAKPPPKKVYPNFVLIIWIVKVIN